MRKTVGASESSSIYLMGICAGSLLSLFLSLALRSTDATLDGMSVYSWCGYAIMQIGFIATVFIFSAVRKIDVVSVAKLKGKLNVFEVDASPEYLDLQGDDVYWYWVESGLLEIHPDLLEDA